MSRLKTVTDRRRAEGGKLLVPYLVAGDPDLPTTLELMHALVDAGADAIELGIPFSDPSSDGPVIQLGAERALANGTTLAQVLELVSQFRRTDANTAIVLMGYLNPVEIMGYEKFASSCAEAQVDGVLLVDLPPTEAASLEAPLSAAGIDMIFLVAPTTSPARARSIAQHCRGYLYYVSLKGVTGAAITGTDAIRDAIAGLRQLTDLPIVVGFGIKDPSGAASMARLADGVAIGSALVSRIGGLSASGRRDAAAIADCVSLIRACRVTMDQA